MTDATRISLERIDPNTKTQNVNYQKTVEMHLERYRYVQKYVANKRVLDAACGTGYGSALMCREGHATEVLGLDVSLQAIEGARQNYSLPGVKYLQLDIESEEFPGAPYDCIVSLETIEHLQDPAKFISKLKHSLIDGGSLFASVPVTQTSDVNRFHLHDFTRSGFLKLLENNGFQIDADFEQPFFMSFVEMIKTSNGDEMENTLPPNIVAFYIQHPIKLLKRFWMTLTRFGFDGAVITVKATKN